MNNIKVTDVRCNPGDSAFLIDDGSTAVLYDTGFGFTGFAVAENIKAVLDTRPLDYIFLTHSHYDHALGSAYILRCFPTAKVVAGSYASDVFRREGAKRTMRELDRKFAERCGVYDYPFLGDELRVDIEVDDGDTVTAGNMQFETLHLPGHTRCSVGYYLPAESLFLSCETLGVYDGDRTVVPSFLVGCRSSLEAIERVSALHIEHILSPHYGLLDRQQTEFFLKNMKTAAEYTIADILAGLKNGESEENILERFKERYWHGYIKDIYPEDAVNLNTSIMIKLIEKELLEGTR